MSINRDEFLQEQILREYIRNRLIEKEKNRLTEETQLRKVIRRLLIEAEATDEVPAVIGDSPRIVLATFIGDSADDEEVLVWA